MARALIFERAVLREISQTAGAVFVALFAILLTTQLIRLLGQAAGGKLASEAVIALLGFNALNYLAIVLSLTVFISILMTLSRWYKDSEMVVWFASGLPLTAWISPVLKFTLPMVLAIALLSLGLSPWALSKSAEYRQRMDAQGDFAKISPGSFKESTSGERVFFVEEGKEGQAGVVKNVFVSTRQHGRMGVMMSGRGFSETAPSGDRYLVLENGRRYEAVPGTAQYRLMQFDSYAVRIENKEAREVARTPRNETVMALLRNFNQANQAEMVWRLGIPLAALNLALLAIPLAYIGPRSGRASNLMIALFAYMIYSNLISIVQSWVGQGRLGFDTGWWILHAAMLAVLALMFVHRMRLFSWRRLRP